jgi:hypothetical protein
MPGTEPIVKLPLVEGASPFPSEERRNFGFGMSNQGTRIYAQPVHTMVSLVTGGKGGTLTKSTASAFLMTVKLMRPRRASSSAMLMFLRQRGSGTIFGRAPLTSCLLLNPATTIIR